MFFIFFINDNISCNYKYNCKSLRITWLIDNKKLINLNGLNLLLLLLLLGLLLVNTSIYPFYQWQEYHFLFSILIWFFKLFRMIFLMNNKKLINLEDLNLLLLLISLELLIINRFVTFLFIFFVNNNMFIYLFNHSK